MRKQATSIPGVFWIDDMDVSSWYLITDRGLTEKQIDRLYSERHLL